jgi:Na+/H+-translocating membrane pyrophosphatase
MTETNTFNFVYKKMTRLFWIILGYAFLFFTLTIIKYFLKLNIALAPGTLTVWGLSLCILAVLSGVISSNLIRIIFQMYANKKKHIVMEEFLFLQNSVIITPLAASFITDVAFLLQVPQPYLYTILLAGLYGIYCSRPSKRKLALELRYYGLDG